MLFHGAEYNVVDIITRRGFDDRLANTGGMFGSGIYFANMASKSDEYVGRSGGTFKMIIARVSMGNAYRTNRTMSGTRRPPCVNSCTGSCSHDRFDSIWYDSTGKNYEEYMVYDRYQCYPEFVVEYRRI